MQSVLSCWHAVSAGRVVAMNIDTDTGDTELVLHRAEMTLYSAYTRCCSASCIECLGGKLYLRSKLSKIFES